ncbi:MAG TPA: glycosyltransferase family 9 protein [Streptosporangiaceae bacterium]|nr:glycosyltransferase family 9 protein [Streptosporangiaceae bacterium]
MARARSVLLLRALGLGDFLTGVPAYRAVRRGFPGYQVVLAAPSALAPLVPLAGAIDELLPTGELEPIGWPGPAPAVGIDLHGRGPASHRLVAGLGPERLIVFGGEHAGGFTGPVWRPDEHEVARWCRLLAESGIPADPSDLLLSPPEGAAFGAAPGPRVTIVHPGAAAPGRRWPADRFAAVARRLAAAGHAVRITGSAAERDLASRVAGRAGLPETSVLAGCTSLAELVALVAPAHLVVSGDTGMSHLATAFARPSVTLFGPVPPAEWGPPQHSRHQVLWAGDPGYRGDPHGAGLDPALAAITVEDVGQAVDRACA